MFKKIALATLTAAVVASLAACQTSSPDVVQRGDAQRMSTVQDGVLLNIRAVTIDGSQSGGGGVVGAVVGGVAGSNVGGNRTGTIAGVLGAVVGGVVGNAVERASTKEDGQELLIQLKNGDRRSIIQAKGTEALNVGDSVIIVTSGGKVRVIKAPSVPSGQPAPAATGQ